MPLLIFLALMIIPPYIVAKCLLRWRPDWRRWVIALVAASLIPATAMIPLIGEFIFAVQSPQLGCGIDLSCMAFGVVALGVCAAAILFFCGFLVSSVVVYPLPRSRNSESSKITK